MWRNHLPFESSSLLSRGGVGDLRKKKEQGERGRRQRGWDRTISF
jgi:hypothetical protein